MLNGQGSSTRLPSSGILFDVIEASLETFHAAPFGGLFPWLAARWQQLRASVTEATASKEDRELLHLVEFAVLRFGDPLLRAENQDALDDQLDSFADSPDALNFTALAARLSTQAPASHSLSSEHLSSLFSGVLGAAQGRAVVEARVVIDAWLDAQRQAAFIAKQSASSSVPQRDVTFNFSLVSPALPAEFAELLFHAIRASFCMLAIACVHLGDNRPVEPWWARAVVDRLVFSAREHLRLLASFSVITVDESIIPLNERLDLAAVEARHLRARAAALRSLEAARVKLSL